MNCKRAWANVRSSSRWVEAVRIQCWTISPTTKIFTAPPPPTYMPKEEFGKKMGAAIEARFHDVAAAVQKLRARGGKVVFVRFPHSGELKKLEDRGTPRAGIWDRVIKDTGAPGIYY